MGQESSKEEADNKLPDPVEVIPSARKWLPPTAQLLEGAADTYEQEMEYLTIGQDRIEYLLKRREARNLLGDRITTHWKLASNSEGLCSKTQATQVVMSALQDLREYSMLNSLGPYAQTLTGTIESRCAHLAIDATGFLHEGDSIALDELNLHILDWFGAQLDTCSESIETLRAIDKSRRDKTSQRQHVETLKAEIAQKQTRFRQNFIFVSLWRDHIQKQNNANSSPQSLEVLDAKANGAQSRTKLKPKQLKKLLTPAARNLIIATLYHWRVDFEETRGDIVLFEDSDWATRLEEKLNENPEKVADDILWNIGIRREDSRIRQEKLYKGLNDSLETALSSAPSTSPSLTDSSALRAKYYYE